MASFLYIGNTEQIFDENFYTGIFQHTNEKALLQQS